MDILTHQEKKVRWPALRGVKRNKHAVVMPHQVGAGAAGQDGPPRAHGGFAQAGPHQPLRHLRGTSEMGWAR